MKVGLCLKVYHFQTPFLLSPMAAEMCMNENPDARKLRVCDCESHMPATNPVIRQLKIAA